MAAEDSFDWIRTWVEQSPYTRTLGVLAQEVSTEAARLRLPYSDNNSNPGQALHGGCAASLAVVGGQAVTRAALGADSGPWHICGMQVNYLSAAIGEDVTAQATLLRRGKEMCFVEIDVATVAGKSIAHATAMVRGRFGAEAAQGIPSAGDDGSADPGTMGPLIGKTPFMGQRGIVVENMKGGRSRLVMPFAEANADASGGVHEGAVLALLDTTGAMASWAETGPGPYRASTPSMQAQVLAPATKQDLVGYGRVLQRDGAIFWSAVEIAGAADGKIVARGTVIYRILS